LQEARESPCRAESKYRAECGAYEMPSR